MASMEKSEREWQVVRKNEKKAYLASLQFISNEGDMSLLYVEKVKIWDGCEKKEKLLILNKKLYAQKDRPADDIAFSVTLSSPKTPRTIIATTTLSKQITQNL